MPVVTYQAPLIEDIASEEAADTTSSQILLSRGVACSDARPIQSTQAYQSVSTSLAFESGSTHVMSLGYAACSSVSGEDSTVDLQGERSPTIEAETSLRLTGTGQSTIETIRSTTDNILRSENPPSGSPTPNTLRFTIKDKGKGIDRGRQLEREPRCFNPLERSESVPQKWKAAIEVDARPIKRKPPSRSSTFHDDPADPRAVLDDKLLEPCPSLTISNNVSEVLDSDNSFQSHESSHQSRTRAVACQKSAITPRQISIDNESTHTPITAFRECQPIYPEPTLPLKMVSQVSPDIIQLELLADQSSTPPDLMNDLGSSLAAQLPTEIIQQVLYHLSPSDFNSARHTCRSWFFSSLERSILETMFRRGGWASSTPRDGTHPPFDLEHNLADGEWHLSKRLSRECALGADWKGNGVIDNRDHSSSTIPGSPFIHTSTVDFTEIAVHYSSSNSSGTIFTMSSCGRFLMAANGCLIYVYEINRRHSSSDDDSVSHPGYLRPVTSIICPRRVVACSMDTSSHRYAVAALLDGRMGLVCDLEPSNIVPVQIKVDTESNSFPGCPIPSGQNYNPESSDRLSFIDRVCLNSSATAHTSCIGQNSSAPLELPFVFPGITTTSPSTHIGLYTQTPLEYDDAELLRAAGPSLRNSSLPRVHGVGSSSRLRSLLAQRQEPQSARESMPIETGPRSIYRNICSDDDPPRSVAICPQRRCVAFGCSAGIELHWVDALTGQDLNRWFPLTAPSDYLYFLPPRKSVDSAKKLRLISSSARPGERAAISQRAFGGNIKCSPFWDSTAASQQVEEDTGLNSNQSVMIRIRGEGGNRRLIGSRMVDCSDHYYAIPLSDGYHILFTDPATGLLCLGSDAPIGGLTKLLRKFWFKGPEGQGSPIAYAGGADLTKGVKVVAAYGTGAEQRIWLFSVPLNVFTSNHGPQTLVAGSWLRSSSITESNKTDWQVWWPSDDGLQDWRNHTVDPVTDILPKSVWPVKIRGQELGTCSGLVDLTIDSGPCMTVWAFSKAGVSMVWRIDGGTDDYVKTLRVMRDGSIREEDADGDLMMTDALSCLEIFEPPLPLSQESFDGTSVFPDPENDVVCLCHAPGNVWTQKCFTDVELAHSRGSEDHKRVLRSYESFESYHNNAAELSAGIARIDIEVLG
jgi:hypothetical protein